MENIMENKNFLKLSFEEQLNYVKTFGAKFEPKLVEFGLPTIAAARANKWIDGSDLIWEQIYERFYTRPYYSGEGRNSYKGIAHYTETVWRCEHGTFKFTECDD